MGCCSRSLTPRATHTFQPSLSPILCRNLPGSAKCQCSVSIINDQPPATRTNTQQVSARVSRALTGARPDARPLTRARNPPWNSIFQHRNTIHADLMARRGLHGREENRGRSKTNAGFVSAARWSSAAPVARVAASGSRGWSGAKELIPGA